METTGETLDRYMGLPYAVEVEHDPGSERPWFAKVVELPGCMTEAPTLGELGPMIEDAKCSWLKVSLERGDPIPEPGTAEGFSGKFNLWVPKSLHRDLARKAEAEGVSLNHLVVTMLARYVSG